MLVYQRVDSADWFQGQLTWETLYVMVKTYENQGEL